MSRDDWVKDWLARHPNATLHEAREVTSVAWQSLPTPQQPLRTTMPADVIERRVQWEIDRIDAELAGELNCAYSPLDERRYEVFRVDGVFFFSGPMHIFVSEELAREFLLNKRTKPKQIATAQAPRTWGKRSKRAPQWIAQNQQSQNAKRKP